MPTINLSAVNTIPTVRTGTGTMSSTGKVVTGTGTAFLSEIKIGFKLFNGVELKTVTKVFSDTSIEIDSAFGVALDADAVSYLNLGDQKLMSFSIAPSGAGVEMNGVEIPADIGVNLRISDVDRSVGRKYLKNPVIDPSTETAYVVYELWGDF